MKKFKILFLIPICTITANAQSTYRVEDKFAKMPVEYVELKPGEAGERNLLNVSKINVTDARFDTSCVGFIEKGSNKQHKVAFRNGMSQQVSSFITSNFLYPSVSDSLPKVLMVIKKLWFSSNYDTSTSEIEHIDNSVNAVLLTAEFYEESNNKYKPLYKVDTAITTERVSSNSLYEVFEKAITASLARFSSKNPVYLKTSKWLTAQQVQEYNNQQFDIPILKAANPAKGVYATYKDFRNNAPTYTNYQVEFGTLGDMLFVKDADGKEAPIRNVWGFSDGQTVFMKLVDNYYPLIKAGNTYNVYGAKELKKKRSIRTENIMMFGLAGGALGAQNKRVTFSIVTKPYQLDLLTGNIY